MHIIEDQGGGTYSTYAVTPRLRWVARWDAPTHSTTTPVLQQCWLATDYENGKAVRQRDDWRNVELVVLQD